MLCQVEILQGLTLTHRNSLSSKQYVNSSCCYIATDDLNGASCDANDQCDEHQCKTNTHLTQVLFHPTYVDEAQSSNDTHATKVNTSGSEGKGIK